ncbi:MAG: CapA family protein [Oscillospiraceae bacterium]|nr:CapA family protein [Oscillospiraceae bacterium]
MRRIIKPALLIILSLLLIVIIFARLSGTELSAPAETPVPKTSPIPSEETEPQPEYFTFNFVGDNTLDGAGFAATTEGRADFPYANTKKYFEGGEFNFANLECIISDSSLYSDSLFHFKAPTRFTEMLTWAGIDFVTTANNHTMDYGQRGLEDTLAALDAAGIAYGLHDRTTVYTTANGIRLGIYCASNTVNIKSVEPAVTALKAENPDLIICAFHWGNEGSYRPTAAQTAIAHAAIDAGADFVYGSHPHVLQPLEEYGGGLIIYSLSNWSFGGNSRPADMDTAILQLNVMRDTDGIVSVVGYTLIPCRMSSLANYNDYCPTPYEEGTTEYDRAMSKLLGTYTGPDLVVDYSSLRPKPTEEPAEPTPSDTPASPEVTPEPSPPPESENTEVT